MRKFPFLKLVETTQVFKLFLLAITYKNWQKESALKNWKKRTNKTKIK
jgi:hypothetical protein